MNNVIKKYYKLILVFFLFSNILGCASHRAQDLYGNEVVDIFSVFKKGELRLNCEVSCSGKWGAERNNFKHLYDNAMWHDLVMQVATVGFKSDQTYYFLGRSAEGLGYKEAAMKYYKLALSSFKCNGIFNNCDGIIFPDAINDGFRRLEKITIENSNKIYDFKKNICVQDSDCSEDYICITKEDIGECKFKEKYSKSQFNLPSGQIEKDSDNGKGIHEKIETSSHLKNNEFKSGKQKKKIGLQNKSISYKNNIKTNLPMLNNQTGKLE